MLVSVFLAKRGEHAHRNQAMNYSLNNTGSVGLSAGRRGTRAYNGELPHCVTCFVLHAVDQSRKTVYFISE